MKYRVVVLRRAEADVRHIIRWIAQRSLQGADSWLDAYEHLLLRLVEQADSCASALDDADSTVQLRQALFATKRGHIYRAVFTIVGNEVRILRVRGPGQPPLQDELK